MKRSIPTAAALVMLWVVACGGAAPAPSVKSGAPVPGAVHAPGELSFSPTAVSKPGRMHQDVLWRRATALDPSALAELADAEGASGLMEGVRLGGALGNAGLQALSYAPDAELALGPLCRLAKQLRGGALQAVLRSAFSIAERVPQDRERIGSDGIVECHAILAQLSTQSDRAPRARDLADATRVRLQQVTR